MILINRLIIKIIQIIKLNNKIMYNRILKLIKRIKKLKRLERYHWIY